MNIEEAMRVLSVTGRVEDLDCAALRRQYRRKALLYHPDKSSAPDATDQFLRLKTALDVLESRAGLDPGPVSESSYFTSLARLVRTALDPDIPDFERIETLQALFDSLVYCGGDHAECLLDTIDYSALRSIFSVLDNIRISMGLPVAVLRQIRAALERRRPPPVSITLRPALADLFLQNVFLLGGGKIRVPLWASEVVFEDPDTGADIEIACVPVVPEGVRIDERNNITVMVELEVREVWGREHLSVAIGEHIFTLRVAELRLVPTQTVALSHLGAPVFNSEDIYSVRDLAGVFADVRLSMSQESAHCHVSEN
jgi:curved DNA-binding protein CbpA